MSYSLVIGGRVPDQLSGVFGTADQARRGTSQPLRSGSASLGHLLRIATVSLCSMVASRRRSLAMLPPELHGCEGIPPATRQENSLPLRTAFSQF